MKYEEINVSKAKGFRISNLILLSGGRILPKGHELTEEDIEELKKMGINKIFGSELTSKDIDFRTALGMLGATLCGENTAYTIDEFGILKIVATKSGVLQASEDRISKFNRLPADLVLNAIEVYSKVEVGEVIAQIENKLPVLEKTYVEEVLYKFSGNIKMFNIVVPNPQNASLVYTRFYNNADENAHFTAILQKLINELEGLNISFTSEYNASHQIQEVADSLDFALKTDNEIVFVVSGQKSNSLDDVIPEAVRLIADEIIADNVPQVGVSDLMIAVKRNKKIIVLPYNYAQIDSKILLRYIMQAIACDKLTPFDFSRPQNVVLPPNQTLTIREQARLVGVIPEEGAKQNNIAAIILAAGQSKRSGINKLMVEVDGEPLFMKSVHAAIKSKINPVYVITGYQNKEIEDALENIDVNILYNPEYHSGIKTSISIGLKTLPSFCDGAVVLPADMPNITHKHLDHLADAYKKGEGAQLCISSYKGVKYNPVLWSRELFDEADIIPEDSDIRIVFPQFQDITTLVEVKNKKELLDVNNISDIDNIIRTTPTPQLSKKTKQEK